MVSPGGTQARRGCGRSGATLLARPGQGSWHVQHPRFHGLHATHHAACACPSNRPPPPAPCAAETNAAAFKPVTVSGVAEDNASPQVLADNDPSTCTTLASDESGSGAHRATLRNTESRHRPACCARSAPSSHAWAGPRHLCQPCLVSVVLTPAAWALETLTSRPRFPCSPSLKSRCQDLIHSLLCVPCRPHPMLQPGWS